MATPHDALFRKVFSDPRYGRELIELALPDSLWRDLRIEALELRSTEFLSESLGTRRADLLFDVETTRGPASIYVLLEHKSHVDPDTVLQLLDYVVQIWMRARSAKERPRLVYPIVVHHGARSWSAARSMHDFVGLDASASAEVRGCTPDYRYFLLELCEKRILAARRLSAFVKLVAAILAGPRTRAALTARLVRIARLFPAARQEDADVELVYTYVLEVGKLGASDLVRILRPTLALRHLRLIMDDMEILTRHLRSQLREEVKREVYAEYKREAMREGVEGKREGLVEGKREGLVEGKRQVVLALLSQRFGRLPDAVRSKIEASDAATLERIALRILDAESIDDLITESAD